MHEVREAVERAPQSSTHARTGILNRCPEVALEHIPCGVLHALPATVLRLVRFHERVIKSVRQATTAVRLDARKLVDDGHDAFGVPLAHAGQALHQDLLNLLRRVAHTHLAQHAL